MFVFVKKKFNLRNNKNIDKGNSRSRSINVIAVYYMMMMMMCRPNDLVSIHIILINPNENHSLIQTFWFSFYINKKKKFGQKNAIRLKAYILNYSFNQTDSNVTLLMNDRSILLFIVHVQQKKQSLPSAPLNVIGAISDRYLWKKNQKFNQY